MRCRSQTASIQRKEAVMKSTFHAVGLVVLLSVAQGVQAEDSKATAPRASDLTLGKIQVSIRSGMSTSEILEVAGSPNLVTRGRNGKESWVYDRFATETSEQGFHVGGGGIGGAGSFLGALGLNGGRKKTSTSQRTLMLIVTFGTDGTVESFTYRSSKF
jgi:hypothetical protein